ncbi:MAG: hypothetical protein ABSH24_36165 [Bryobacteraceae bacterium]|jgi:hypothetical protein
MNVRPQAEEFVQPEGLRNVPAGAESHGVAVVILDPGGAAMTAQRQDAMPMAVSSSSQFPGDLLIDGSR